MPTTPFFDAFPKIQYDINGVQNPSYETVTNIFHRLGYVKEVLANASSYYYYEIKDEDTPENLAEKVYGNPNAGWMIIYANNIVDPQWDWPLDDESFKAYVTERYGSLSAATSSVHHYEKVVETTINGITTTRIYWVNGERLTNNPMVVPYEYYSVFRELGNALCDHDTITVDSITLYADNDYYETNDTSLPAVGSYEAFDVNGQTVTVNVYGREVNNYDYELEQNNAKRTIKIVKAVYYNKVMDEFVNLTKSLPKYVRTFV